MTVAWVYSIRDEQADAEQLVIAHSQAQAIRFVVGERFTARVASALEVARAGGAVLDATAKPQGEIEAAS